MYELIAADISKSFSDKKVLNAVHCVFRAGRIHALLGENGAGKSTLVSILSGSLAPDQGTIFINGQPAVLRSRKNAQKHGISIVHQHPCVSNDLKVHENIILGCEPSYIGGFIKLKQAKADISKLISQWNIDIDIEQRIAALPAPGRFYTELLAALYRKPSILILDEPTASLDAVQRTALFDNLRTAADGGLCIILITHNMQEAVRFADTITVLRKGIIAANINNEHRNTDERYLNECIFGTAELSHSIADDMPTVPGQSCGIYDGTTRKKKRSPLKTAGIPMKPSSAELSALNSEEQDRQPLLSFEHVVIREKNMTALLDADFSVYRGKITTIIGQQESGLQTIEEVLIGIQPVRFSGTILFHGNEVSRFTPKMLRDNGSSIVPFDKKFRASHPALTTASIVSVYSKWNISAAAVHAILQEADVKIKPEEPASHLSGGMLQRLILTRELSRKPVFLLLSAPFYGLDSRNAKDLAVKLRTIADAGTAVLILSNTSQYIKPYSDFVYTISGGHVRPVIRSSHEESAS